MTRDIIHLREEAQQELKNILDWWRRFMPDEVHGGFLGKVNYSNTGDPNADKGSVLNSRILWTFSAAYRLFQYPWLLDIANRASAYIQAHFIDKEFGGVFWTVDNKGKPVDTKKQIYAQAFALYGFSEYHLATGSIESKQLAIELYGNIEKYSYDSVHGGYIEALKRDWQETMELQLSAKDFNEKKSMNTHLHVLEAYTNLYRIWQDPILKARIRELILLFLNKIIDSETGHLMLFFNMEWGVRSSIYSYGHDIEATWLIQEAAEIINDLPLLHKVKEMTLKMVKATNEGLDNDGGLWYEYDPDKKNLIREKHWWTQAEAMVGFYSSFQNTGDKIYLHHCFEVWDFIKKYLLDRQHGEWFWGIKGDYRLMEGEDKAGLWKCPYHNGRACMELMKRIPVEKNY